MAGEAFVAPLGVYSVNSAGVADPETDNVVVRRQGDVPNQKGRLRLVQGELTFQGTQAELEALFGQAVKNRDSYIVEVRFTPVLKSKSAGG